MEENECIDDFSLDKAKRNMAKMLKDAQGSAGVKKVFSGTSVVKENQLKSPNQTINIFPNQVNDNQALLVQEILNCQKMENANLNERVRSLEKVESRLTGLEIILKQQIAQQSNLLESSSVQNNKRDLKPYILMGVICFIALSFLVFTNINEPKKVVVSGGPSPTVAPSVSTNEMNKYVSLKFVDIRHRPSINKGKVLLMLAPNQVLTSIDRQGDWFKVTYRDYIKSKDYTGWVFGENIKRLN